MASSLKYFLFILNTVLSYNIDEQFFSVFEGPINSYFGYSVAFLNTSEGLRILVGSPRHQSIEHHSAAMTFFACDPGTELCQEGYVNIPHTESIEETGHWLGVSMESISEKNVVICSHLRTQKEDNIPGFCYVVDEMINPTILNLPKFVQYNIPPSSLRYQVAQAGISLHAVTQHNMEYELMVGSVGLFDWRGGVIHFSNLYYKEIIMSHYEGMNKEVYFGYSSTSGRYFFDNQLYYVTAAPRYKETGMVIIYRLSRSPISQKMTYVTLLEGFEVGEYFGASLCSIKIKEDDSDILLIGSPFYSSSTYEEGLVYIFKSTKRNNNYQMIQSQLPLDGSQKTSSRFGSTITAVGDLDLDGYQDVAIGAPFEDESQGTVYIYRGNYNGLIATPSQIIAGKTFNSQLLGFGISISKAKDVDKNKYPDFLVGGFLSSQVVLLRSRPVIDIQTYLLSTKRQINLNNENCKQETTTCFEVFVCFNYMINNGPSKIGINYEIQIDALNVQRGQKPRAKFWHQNTLTSIINESSTISERQNCSTHFPVRLSSVKITNLNSPIVLKMNYKLEENEMKKSSFEFQKTTPILNSKYPNSDEIWVSINYFCKYDPCQTDLKIAVETNLTRSFYTPFDLTRNILTFDVTVNHQHEAALMTEVFINTNEYYTISSLQGVTEGDNYVTCDDLTYLCRLGNLLENRNEVHFQIKLNVRMKEPLDLVINFTVTSSSLDIKLQDNTVLITFPVKEVVDVTGTGSPESSTEYCSLDKQTQCFVEHNYLITNLGDSNINELILNIYWPYVQTDSEEKLLTITQDKVLPNGCNFTDFNNKNTARKIKEIRPSKLDCRIMECEVILRCNISNLQGLRTLDFTVSISGYLNTAVYKIMSSSKDLTIVSKAIATISFDKQLNAIQEPDNQPDNFTVSTVFVFANPLPLLPIILGAIAGFLFLLIVLLLLVKLGFFRRKNYNDGKPIKTTDSSEQILNGDKQDIPNYTQQEN